MTVLGQSQKHRKVTWSTAVQEKIHECLKRWIGSLGNFIRWVHLFIFFMCQVQCKIWRTGWQKTQVEILLELWNGGVRHNQEASGMGPVVSDTTMTIRKPYKDDGNGGGGKSPKASDLFWRRQVLEWDLPPHPSVSRALRAGDQVGRKEWSVCLEAYAGRQEGWAKAMAGEKAENCCCRSWLIR